VILSTLFGYGVWNQLIIKHGAKKVAPFSLLVPVFGMTSGTLVLRETFTPANALAAALILAGLAIHVFGGKLDKQQQGK
jgi:O-acetylserine/cysteine efflux transporter